MLKSTAIEILRTFSKEDLINFEDFIKSPYFNKIKNVEKLFFILIKYSPEYTNEKLEKEIIWGRIFPGKEYNYGTMKNLIYELQKCFENFLSITHFRGDFDYDNNLIQELINRNLINQSKKKLKIYEEKNENLPSKNELYYHNSVFITNYKSFFEAPKSLITKSGIQDNDSILKSFLVKYFQSTLYFHVEEQRSNVKHDFEFSDYLIEYFEKNSSKLEDSPLIYIKFLLLLSLKYKEEEKYYFEAKRVFEDIYNSLDYVDKMSIYSSLINNCMIKSKVCNKKFLRETLELEKKVLYEKSKIKEEYGSLPLFKYRNIILQSITLKDFDFLKKFLNDYKNKIECDNPEGLELYSNAYLTFIENDFNKCLEHCSLISFKDFFPSIKDSHFYKNDIKLLMLKCYYELNLSENLISSVDSYKHYLNNGKIIKSSQIERSLNFSNLLLDINSLKNNNGNLTADYLRHRLTNIENISFKDWLLEKIDELEK